MGRPPSDNVQVSVRVPGDWVERIEAVSQGNARRGHKSDKASVLRAAVEIGLQQLELEQEHGMVARVLHDEMRAKLAELTAKTAKRKPKAKR